MRITQLEMVTRHYCDECGKEITGNSYGYGIKIYGTCCRAIWQAKAELDRTHYSIRKQPFF